MSTRPESRQPARASARETTEPLALRKILAERSGVLIQGDSLAALRAMPDAFVDLIYIDPPFNTGKNRRLQSIALGSGERERTGYQGRRYRYRVKSDLRYSDDMPRHQYLAFLHQRLVEARRVLKRHGSIYVHVDYHAAHHVRLLLDEVFGERRFLNEIIWAYDYGGRPRDRWPPKHDNIFWYAKSNKWTFNADAADRLPYMAPSLVGPEKAARGKLPTDVWWVTIVPTNSPERTGYPTQKPEKLLERIIRTSSNAGEVVMDFFGGSGTTAVVAEKLGRKWIYVDTNPEAVRITRERLAGAAGGMFAARYEVLELA